MMKYYRNENSRGSSFAYAIILIVLLAILSSGFFYMSNFNMQTTVSQNRELQQEYMAKSLHNSVCRQAEAGELSILNNILVDVNRKVEAYAEACRQAEIEAAQANADAEEGDEEVEPDYPDPPDTKYAATTEVQEIILDDGQKIEVQYDIYYEVEVEAETARVLTEEKIAKIHTLVTYADSTEYRFTATILFGGSETTIIIPGEEIEGGDWQPVEGVDSPSFGLIGQYATDKEVVCRQEINFNSANPYYERGMDAFSNTTITLTDNIARSPEVFHTGSLFAKEDMTLSNMYVEGGIYSSNGSITMKTLKKYNQPLHGNATVTGNMIASGNINLMAGEDDTDILVGGSVVSGGTITLEGNVVIAGDIKADQVIINTQPGQQVEIQGSIYAGELVINGDVVLPRGDIRADRMSVQKSLSVAGCVVCDELEIMSDMELEIGSYLWVYQQLDNFAASEKTSVGKNHEQIEQGSAVKKTYGNLPGTAKWSQTELKILFPYTACEYQAETIPQVSQTDFDIRQFPSAEANYGSRKGVFTIEVNGNCRTELPWTWGTQGNNIDNKWDLFYGNVAGSPLPMINRIEIVNADPSKEPVIFVDMDNLKAAGINSVAMQNITVSGGTVVFYSQEAIHVVWCQSASSNTGFYMPKGTLELIQGGVCKLGFCIAKTFPSVPSWGSLQVTGPTLGQLLDGNDMSGTKPSEPGIGSGSSHIVGEREVTEVDTEGKWQIIIQQKGTEAAEDAD